MEFIIVSNSLASFEDQTALMLRNLRITPQMRQRAINNIPVATNTIASRLFQAFQPEKSSPHIRLASEKKMPAKTPAVHQLASDTGFQIPRHADPTKHFPAIGDGIYEVSRDIAFQKISDRGRNATDFYHFGNHYPYVLVVNRATGAHSWTLGKDTAPSWIKIAMEEVGVSEIAGKTNDLRVMEYQHAMSASIKTDDDGDPWCATFVNWVLLKAGLPRTGTLKGQNGRRAAEFDTYGIELAKPTFGCIATFNHKGQRHVGFIVGKITKGQSVSYAVLGGNQSDQVNVQLKPHPVKCSWPVCSEAMGKPEELKEYDNQYGFLGANGSTR